MENYYDTTAFSSQNQKTFNNEKVIVTPEHIDLRLFSDCPYLLDASDTRWFNYNKKPKPHGTFISALYVRWIERRHKQIFKAEPFSNVSLFSLLFMMGLAGVWFFGGGLILISFYFWLKFSKDSFISTLNESGAFWVIGISYLISKIGKYGANYYQDECGLIFDRPSGKVLYMNGKGEIVKKYDFKDFQGELDDFINTGGQKEPTAYATHKTEFKSTTLGVGLLTGAIQWSYLVRFMDITQPLPDIPDHETTRHLDPVTKAYDEKTGRDPNYWAKHTQKEFQQLIKEDLKKADEWVEARKRLLNERGIHDLDFLNQLLSGDISA